MGVAVDQRRDHIAENGERKVDVRRFFETLALQKDGPIDSRRISPFALTVEPVFACRSLPAKSTKFNFPTRICALPSAPIYSIVFPSPRFPLLSTYFATFHRNDENRVRSRTVFVHVRRARRSIHIAGRHHMFDFLRILRDERTEILHVHPFLRMLLQIQTFVLIPRKQIANAFLEKARESFFSVLDRRFTL